MDFVIDLPQRHQKEIDRSVKNNDLMRKDMRMATLELSKVNELKRAIKILKKTNKIDYEN